jgi:hypothetical protein
MRPEWGMTIYARAEHINPRSDDDDQWRYSPDRALASVTGFMIVV